MRIATWNVNGIRARQAQVCEWLERDQPDVVCLQELKASPAQIPDQCKMPDYHVYWHVGRALDPENAEMFTWWAPWRNMRQRNIGWRLDYILASREIAAGATACTVLSDVGTSDHAPVMMTTAH